MIRCDYRPLFRETRRANSKRVGGVYAIQKSCLRLRYYRPRQEGGGSYSHVRAYEKLQPFHHLDVKFNAIRAILLRSDAFSFNAIRYPLSLSLSPFHTFSMEKERGRERESVGKDRGMENYGYQAEKGKHFAREGAYRRNTDRDNWSQVTRTYEKGRR